MKNKRSTQRSQTPHCQFYNVDRILLGSVFMLLSLGLVMVYSSSAANGIKLMGDPEFYLRKQLFRAFIGVILLLGISRLPLLWLSQRAGWIFMASTALCGAVLIPGLGVVRGGARRWIEIGGFVIQPSEVAKLAIIILVAALFANLKSREEKSNLWGPILLAQVPIIFILSEPDLGTALVIELILGMMIFVAGVKIRSISILVLLALPVFYHFIVSTPYRMRRILGYINPWAYRQSIGYQVTEGLISMGSGGITGQGLGEGKHSLFYLPEAHTDFIFAILGQELGWLGVVMLLALFGVFIVQAAKIALRADSDFNQFLAVGLLGLIAIPAVINTCVVTGLVPTKGLPLPFISYGGSNLVLCLASVGILLRLDLEQKALVSVRTGRA